MTTVRRTENIPAAVIRDALSVCGGLCRMNATGAVGYGFLAGDKEVSVGAFRWASDMPTGEWDGVIDFRTGVLTDQKSGETRKVLETP